MSPKNAKAKKKKVEKEFILDGKNISKMTQEQLIRHAVLEAKLLLEAKKQGSVEEQERDILFRKMEIVRDGITKQEAQLISQARNTEKIQDIQHAELKVNRQRAKHMRYELIQSVENAKLEENTFAQTVQREHKEILLATLQERKELEAKNSNERRAQEQNMKEIMTEAKGKFNATCENYRNALIDHTENLRTEKEQFQEDSELDVRSNICLLNQKRLEQIEILQRNFEKNFQETKQYFQEITHHNLTLINDLSSQSQRLKKNLNNLHKRFCDVQKQTEVSREPLRLQTQRLSSLKAEFDLFNKEKASYVRLQKSFMSMKEEEKQLLKDINDHNEEYTKIKAEHALLRENFGPALSEAKEIIGFEASFICSKAANLKTKVENVETSLREAALNNPDARMEECLYDLEQTEQQCLNNTALKRNLQTTLDKMAKLYNDSLVTMRYIVEEYDLPTDQIDLQPLANGMAFKPAEIGRVTATPAGKLSDLSENSRHL